MPLTLHPAEPADLPAIAALMNLAFRGNGTIVSWNTEEAFIDGDRTSEAALKAELAANPKSVILLVRETPSSPLQACVALEPVSAETWHLGSLAVDPTLQKSGLGRNMLTAAEQWAKQHGATKIQMDVVNVRDTLIAWYERKGYHLTGEIHPFPYGDNRFGVPRRDDLSFVVLEKSLST